MTPLCRRIAELIEATGPISVADYMALCLFDPQHGYYTTREPFGADGDFVTAPEISQMFGELVAVWLVTAWRSIGAPLPVTVAEAGPGRGTLMRDIIRAAGRIAPDWRTGARFALVEASPRLTAIQRRTLDGVGVALSWHETVDTLPDQPLLIVGNELLDALPVRQFVFQDGGWHERAIGLDDEGRLVFALKAGSFDASLLPDGQEPSEGATFEMSPARSAFMQRVCERLAARGGAGIFFDYGHLRTGFRDTFQAVRRHAYEDVLESPGEADLTSHVDFAVLENIAHACGLATATATQGEFLLGMGLVERAGRLGAAEGPERREAIRAAVERLAGPEMMGTLFKVLMLAPRGTVTLPPAPWVQP
jgi:SAM-dependent MidA family methyltransferase